MGCTHPSKLLMSQEEVGKCRFLFRSGNVWCKSWKLLPGQGVPVLPLISLSGGVSITTSFLLTSSYFLSMGVTLKTLYASVKISLRSSKLILASDLHELRRFHSIDEPADQHSGRCCERKSRNCCNDQPDHSNDADPKKGKDNRVFLHNTAISIHTLKHGGRGWTTSIRCE